MSDHKGGPMRFWRSFCSLFKTAEHVHFGSEVAKFLGSWFGLPSIGTVAMELWAAAKGWDPIWSVIAGLCTLAILTIIVNQVVAAIYRKPPPPGETSMSKPSDDKPSPTSSASGNQQTGGSGIIAGRDVHVHHAPAQQPRESNDPNIYQAGVVVGRAHGGRRMPQDATRFEFVEITHAQSFNPEEPFKYQGITLKTISAETRNDQLSGRAQDGMIYTMLIAVVS